MFISFQSWSASARPLSLLILLIPRIPPLKYSVTLCYRITATFLCFYRPVVGIISPVNRSRSTTSLIAHLLFLSSSFFVLPLPVSGQSTNDYQSRSMHLNSVLMFNSARYRIESPRHRSITYSVRMSTTDLLLATRQEKKKPSREKTQWSLYTCHKIIMRSKIDPTPDSIELLAGFFFFIISLRVTAIHR